MATEPEYYDSSLSADQIEMALGSSLYFLELSMAASPGQVLEINETGDWAYRNGIPSSSTSDAGKVLCVGEDGSPFWFSVPEAGGNVF